jgi:hypothetical protein
MSKDSVKVIIEEGMQKLSKDNDDRTVESEHIM